MARALGKWTLDLAGSEVPDPALVGGKAWSIAHLNVMGLPTPPAFVITTAYFVFSHVPWEWGVMLLWTLLTMAWLYHRKHIMSLVLVHAVTNGSILAFVALGSGHVRDIEGTLVDLWFFV